jgi:ribosomal protein S12 methylthiotransferase accessory factor
LGGFSVTTQWDPPAPANAGGLRGVWLKHRDPLLRARLQDDEWTALREVMEHYSPHGVLRAFTTYFRPGAGLPMYVGHGQYLDFDYVLRRLLGLSGLETGIGGQIYGGGKGYDLFGMVASSIGESVERVLGAFAFVDAASQVVYGSYNELTRRGLPCLHPEQMPVFAPEQLSTSELFEPWTEDSWLGWVAGTRLRSGAEVYVPAQLVLLFYLRAEGEPVIGLAPSGGLASHINRTEALYHGILELFERDGVNLRWYCGVPLDRIVLDRPLRDPRLRRLLKSLYQAPDEVSFYYHNLDLTDYPVITAKTFAPWFRRYSYSAGGGVAPDAEAAMLSALTEFSQAERSLKVSLMAPDWEFSYAFGRLFNIAEDATPEQFANYIQAIPFYGYPGNQAKLDRYLNGGRELPLSKLPTASDMSLPTRWDRLMAFLATRGWDPIVFDFSPPEFTQTALVKVVIPELSPPYPPSAPGLGHPRYANVPYEAGYRDRPLTFPDLVSDPLPYP